MFSAEDDQDPVSLRYTAEDVVICVIEELTERYDGEDEVFIGLPEARLVADSVCWRLRDRGLRRQA